MAKEISRRKFIGLGLGFAATLLFGCEKYNESLKSEKIKTTLKTPAAPTPNSTPTVRDSNSWETQVPIPHVQPENKETEIPSPQTWEELNAAVKKEIEGFEGEAALSFNDLKRRRKLSINGEMQFYPASAIKSLILVSVLKDVEDGIYSIETVDKNIREMMAYSDNRAANELIGKTGLEKLSALTLGLGMEKTGFFHGFEDETGWYPSLGLGQNYSCVDNLNLFWTKLYREEILSKNFTKIALSYAQLPQVKIIYSEGEAVIAHKPGYLEDILVDAGLVIENESSYAISFYAQNDQGGQIYQFGDRLTHIVWNFWQKEI